jgi:TPR repeat protein
MYAVGYFLEVGIGTQVNQRESVNYYKRAAELGDKRAAQRLRGAPNQPLHTPGGPGAVLHRGPGEDTGGGGKGKDGKECIIM